MTNQRLDTGKMAWSPDPDLRGTWMGGAFGALGRAPDLAPISIAIVTKDRRAYVGTSAVVLCKPLELDQLAAAIRDALDEEGL